jgi:hypothetical protein
VIVTSFHVHQLGTPFAVVLGAAASFVYVYVHILLGISTALHAITFNVVVSLNV